ncbi:MAG TPA: OmpA family protein [Phycisphaerales bacterium]|nr:OmpA family protein [Phycisphaerales bacterium]
MTKFRLCFVALALAGFGLGGGGCVDQSRYDRLREAEQTQKARNESLVQDKQGLDALVDRKQARINELEAEVTALRNINAGLTGDIDSVRAAQASLAERLKGVNLAMLDPATDSALRELARQYPDVIMYDSARGMVRFMADLTFKSGSADLNEKANQALQKLATIVSNSSGGYDLRVVGHTDSQPLSSSRGKWGTNRGLSSARAISVEQALSHFGVNASRVEVVAWGEYRPAVANSGNGNTPANRRVEILFVPSSGSGPSDTMPAMSSPPPSSPSRRDEMPLK